MNPKRTSHIPPPIVSIGDLDEEKKITMWYNSFCFRLMVQNPLLAAVTAFDMLVFTIFYFSAAGGSTGLHKFTEKEVVDYTFSTSLFDLWMIIFLRGLILFLFVVPTSRPLQRLRQRHLKKHTQLLDYEDEPLPFNSSDQSGLIPANGTDPTALIHQPTFNSGPNYNSSKPLTSSVEFYNNNDLYQNRQVNDVETASNSSQLSSSSQISEIIHHPSSTLHYLEQKQVQDFRINITLLAITTLWAFIKLVAFNFSRWHHPLGIFLIFFSFLFPWTESIVWYVTAKRQWFHYGRIYAFHSSDKIIPAFWLDHSQATGQHPNPNGSFVGGYPNLGGGSFHNSNVSIQSPNGYPKQPSYPGSHYSDISLHQNEGHPSNPNMLPFDDRMNQGHSVLSNNSHGSFFVSEHSDSDSDNEGYLTPRSSAARTRGRSLLGALDNLKTPGHPSSSSIQENHSTTNSSKAPITNIYKTITPSFKEDRFTKETISRVNQLIRLTFGDERDGWVYSTNKTAFPTKSKKSIPGSPLTISRGSLVLDFTPLEICTIFGDFELGKEWDSSFDGGTVVEQLSLSTQCVRIAYKGTYIVKGRDFGLVRCLRLLDTENIDTSTFPPTLTSELSSYSSSDHFVYVDDPKTSHPPLNTVYVAVSWSIDHPDIKEQSSHVRGKLDTTGLVCIPLPPYDISNPKTWVTYVSQIDLCGSIPTMAVNRVADNTPLTLVALDKFMRKKKKIVGPGTSYRENVPNSVDWSK